MKINDKVAFNKIFCRNIKQMTGEIPSARGIIKDLKPFGDTLLAIIEWDNNNIPEKVIIDNLIKVKK